MTAGPHTSESTSTSKSLIQRARQQDPEAWRRLSRLYVPVVYGWARQAGPQATGGTVGQEQMGDLVEIPDEESAEFQLVDSRTNVMHRALDIIRIEFEDKTRQAFWRSTVDEQKSPDIAESLAMTPKAVRQAKYRVLRRLRQEHGQSGVRTERGKSPQRTRRNAEKTRILFFSLLSSSASLCVLRGSLFFSF